MVNRLEEVVEAIEEKGGQALAVQADISIEGDVVRLIGKTIKKFGRVDILINNAAIAGGDFIHDRGDGLGSDSGSQSAWAISD